MSIKVRFAPSPTGLLHVGNIRTAIITWLHCRHEKGTFLLRLDDTDVERSKEEYAQAIQDDLTWLGLNWDEFARQRDRQDSYDKNIQKLKDDGRLYPCYETAEELSLKRKTLLQRGLPPIYDRAALSLTPDQITKYEAEGRTPHWRFKLNHNPIEWDDQIRGPVKFEGGDLADPVLIREDGTPLYHICSVIDDIELGITHVMRGEDHVSNTATHIQMFEALGATPPQFAHLSLISDAEGGKLSKRIGSLSIQDLRDVEKLEPMAIVSLLSRLGTSAPIEAISDINVLIESFDFSNFSRSTPKFDQDDLLRLNAKLLHEADYASVKDRLPAEVDENFWLSVRANLTKLGDIQEWSEIAKGNITPVIEAENKDFIIQAAATLPDSPWDKDTWNTWTNTLKAETGRKGKELFMPLRQALTGMNHGPEMALMLQLIGREKALARLSHG